jgi:anti-sigma B factor antagonist
VDIKQEMRNGWCILTIGGRADALTADAFEQTLVSVVRTTSRVAVDLSSLAYISSAGLRAILQGARAAQENQTELVICDPKASVKTVFDVSGMQRVVRIETALPC